MFGWALTLNIKWSIQKVDRFFLPILVFRDSLSSSRQLPVFLIRQPKRISNNIVGQVLVPKHSNPPIQVFLFEVDYEIIPRRDNPNAVHRKNLRDFWVPLVPIK
jgi:hypothetical protein